MDSSSLKKVIPVEEMSQHTPAELQHYLGLSADEYSQMDPATLRLLMQSRVDTAAQASDDKDAGINTTLWRYMVLPYQWTGYPKPSYIWQPIGDVKKFNFIPLVIGSLKATLVALLFAVPLALGAALYVSQLSSPRWREVLKPTIELLAGIPSVVLGFFACIVISKFLQSIFGYASPLNAFLAGIALGIAVIPVVFTIAEDALTSVPPSYMQAALALGSSRWQAAWKIMLPAAIPGVFAAVVLGFGRAIGETMVVLMASGNASIVSWSLFDSTRTMTASIAAELGETDAGGYHRQILFMLGAVLFLVTFLSNMVAQMVINRLKNKLEGRR
jgi:phosphate transport system permease protein